MTIERVNPPGLATPEGYVHVSIATGSRTIRVAGQVAIDAEGALVGGDDLGAQTTQAVRNVALALAGAGATLDDVVDATLLVVDWHEDKLEALMGGLKQAAAEVGAMNAPTTLIPVPRLFEHGHRIEIVVTAVLD